MKLKFVMGLMAGLLMMNEAQAWKCAMQPEANGFTYVKIFDESMGQYRNPMLMEVAAMMNQTNGFFDFVQSYTAPSVMNWRLPNGQGIAPRVSERETRCTGEATKHLKGVDCFMADIQKKYGADLQSLSSLGASSQRPELIEKIRSFMNCDMGAPAPTQTQQQSQLPQGGYYQQQGSQGGAYYPPPGQGIGTIVRKAVQ